LVGIFVIFLHNYNAVIREKTMKTIVITGSSRGIGRGLAERFLESGHNVVISSSSCANLDKTLQELKGKFPGERVHAVLCDTTIPGNLENLWKEAAERFGKVDIWINNAGVGQSHRNFDRLETGVIQRIIETNVIGVMLGTYTAFRHMNEQGGGQIYNMEGFGSNGSKMRGMSVYGTSKQAVNYFTTSFAMETRHSSVRICGIAPGMVITDFILNPIRDNPEFKKQLSFVIKAIAGEVGPVTEYLAKRILSNKKHGIRIRYKSGLKVLAGFLAAPFRNNDILKKYLDWDR
jgi:NAD(P)-dependent dehydrogenase (short-subunit alcohol dehydrogenase family)